MIHFNILLHLVFNDNFYHFCFHFTVGRYLIAGGSFNFNLHDVTEVVELVNTNSTPSFGHLPSTRWAPVGAMFGNVPILCGGWHFGTYYDSCISFQNSQWSPSHSMNEKRRDAAGVQINSTTFWILGGEYNDEFCGVQNRRTTPSTQYPKGGGVYLHPC